MNENPAGESPARAAEAPADEPAAADSTHDDELATLRAELTWARAWAWAQWHGYYATAVVDPHATEGPAAPPAWLTSGEPPWPHEPIDTSAVPDSMLRALLGRRDATPDELAEVRRQFERQA